MHSSSFYKVILNILVFTNKVQRVPHVKEIDKKIHAFFFAIFFSQAYLFNKILYIILYILYIILYMSRKNTLVAFI